jgi:hypothetical protein
MTIVMNRASSFPQHVRGASAWAYMMMPMVALAVAGSSSVPRPSTGPTASP